MFFRKRKKFFQKALVVQKLDIIKRLLKSSEKIFKKYNEHPFILGIQEGTLDKNKFRYYIIQDYLYLEDFAKTLLDEIDSLQKKYNATIIFIPGGKNLDLGSKILNILSILKSNNKCNEI